MTGRALLKLSVISLASAVIAMAISAVRLAQAYRFAQAEIANSLELKELAGTIVHLDEVLTMSARMAAVTGDNHWETRYRHFEPLLDQAIKRALQLGGPLVNEAITATDVANLKLVDMEIRSFKLTREGRLAEAQALLFSDEYALQKEVYAAGIQQATARLKQRGDAVLTAQRQAMSSSLGLALLLLVLILAIWCVVLLTMRKWQRTLVSQNQQLNELSRTLDHKVAERTGQLVDTNAGLERAKRRIEEQAHTLELSNEKLREMAALKDDFVAKVSHELRTPLTSVKEGLSLLLDRALGPITPDQQDFLQTMDGDVDRLTELINNMLDLSKIEAGRMHLVRTRVDVKRLLESLVRSYQAIVGRRTIRIDAAPVPPIFADTNRIIQVLTNLFSNAIKFTPEEGTITFRVTPAGSHVVVAVEDTGVGMSPEDLPKLFRKFSQVGSHSKGIPRGTGLGLVVCKELIEMHGGRIEVASTPGRGTTFSLRLPVYTDSLALTESFKELENVAAIEDGQGVGLIAIHAELLVRTAAEAGRAPGEAMERLTNEMRQHLHRGDLVLNLDPSWVVVMAAANAAGLQAIVKRLRSTVAHLDQLRIGSALAPQDGVTGAALLQAASARLDEGICYNAEASPNG